MSRSHLALVTLGFEGGGPERDTVLLCNALAAKGARVTILALRDEGPLRALIEPNVHVVIIPERRMRYAIHKPATRYPLARSIRRHQLGNTEPQSRHANCRSNTTAWKTSQNRITRGCRSFHGAPRSHPVPIGSRIKSCVTFIIMQTAL